MKEQFMNELKTALSGQVSTVKYNETVRYYEEYITSQMQAGKTEEEVINSLGSGRLIAKTVIDTAQASGEAEDFYTNQTVYDEEGRNGDETGNHVSFWTKAKLIAIIAGVIIVGLAIISIVASVIWALIPIIAIVVIASWLYRRLMK